jgi:hypothetical protein
MASYFWVGGAGTWSASSSTNWSVTSGGSGGAGVPSGTDTVTFDSLSGTGICSATNGAGGTVIQNSTGITLQLDNNNATLAQVSLTLTQGTIDLNDFNLAVTSFSSNNANTRTINFRANGSLEISGNNGNVFDVANHTNLTVLKSSIAIVNFTYAGGTGTRTITCGNYATTTVADAFFLQILGGTDTIDISSQAFFNLNIIASGSGFAGTLVSNGLRCLGNGITFNTGMTISGITGSIDFRTPASSAVFTTNGKTIPVPLFINGDVGATLAITGSYTSSSYISLNQGIFASVGNTINATYITSSSAGARELNITSSTVNLSNASAFATVFSLGTGTVTLNSGSSTINVSSATATTFDGGGRTFATVNQAGAGALTIAGSNTFNNLGNSVQPTTIVFTSGTTQTLNAVLLSGTAGNLLTITASTPGSRATLSKPSGTVFVGNCSIKDSNATGGATWQALTTNGNVDAGNNLGWDFGTPPSNGNFLAFFI